MERKQGDPTGIYRRFVKRTLDVILSALALIPASIVMLPLGLLIKLQDGGPILFRQTRLGRNGRTFSMLKLRSMRVNAEHTGSGVYSGSNDDRVTGIGRFLRKTSLDELPQLWNILVGDMSIIGPRPALTYHPWPYEQYTEHQKQMFEVRPGLTGWAQVHGRKEVPWPERIELNVWYVQHVSFALDVRILCKTVGKVLTGADNENTKATAQQEGEAHEADVHYE